MELFYKKKYKEEMSLLGHQMKNSFFIVFLNLFKLLNEITKFELME